MLTGFLSGFSCNDSSQPVLGSTCFPEGPFLPSRKATDVAVAPCLAISRRRQFGRNNGINRLNASLSKAIPKHVHMCGNGEVFGEFLCELGQVFSQASDRDVHDFNALF